MSENNNIRISVLGDTTSYMAALGRIESATNLAAEKITGSFEHATSFIKKSIGVAGLAYGLEQAVDKAGELNKVQAVQTTILFNQGIAQKLNVTMTKAQYDAALKSGKTIEGAHSESLKNLAQEYSLKTGMNQQEVARAQTMMLTNSDMVKFLMHGKAAANGPMKGITDNMKSALGAAGDLAAVMGGGKGGSIATTGRLLGRLLADPAKSMGSMKRFGFQLSKDEQAKIKSVQKTNGLMAAQALFVKDIEKHLKKTAENAAMPIDKLKNAIDILKTNVGQVLYPIVTEMATTLLDSGLFTTLNATMTSLGKNLGTVLSEVGKAIGDILKAFGPLLNVIIGNVIPAVLRVLEPILKIAGVVANALGGALQKLFGTPEKLGPLGKLFDNLASTIDDTLVKSVTELVNAFVRIVSGGAINAIFDGISKAFTIMAPVIPALTDAFVKLALAFVPILVAAGPDIGKVFIVFARTITTLTPVLTGAVGLFTGLLKSLKGIAPVIALLGTVWFTRKLFLAPIQAIGDGIDKTIVKFGKMKKGFGNFSIKDKITKTFMPSRYARLKGGEGGMGGGGGGVVGGASDPFVTYLKQIANNTDIAARHLNTITRELMGGGPELGPAMSGGGGAGGAGGAGGSGGKGGRFARLRGGVANAVRGRGRGIGIAAAGAGAIGMAMGGVGGTAGGILGTVGSIASGFGPWGAAIGLAIQGVTLLYSKCKWFRDAVHAVMKFIKNVVHTVVKAITKFWHEHAKTFKAIFMGIWKVIQFIFKIIVFIVKTYIKAMILEVKIIWKVFKFVWDLVWKIVKTVINWIKKLIKAWVAGIKFEIQVIVDAFKWVWHAISSGAKWVWNKLKQWWNDLKGLFHTVADMVTKAGKWIWAGLYNGFVTVANLIIKGWNALTGWIPGLGSHVHITELKTMAAPKFHNGGIVPGPMGKEVPAILQAGEAVVSISQMRDRNRNGGGGVNIASNAMVITIQGNADGQTARQIEIAVNQAFNKFLQKATVHK